ncbi:TetR/AcrR family transcriptional regulator C-terminal domain-containing protein [Streptomyces sp. NPDC008122]|uniref:TetR/AcrR family transcriptional regulator C-terminal domain-containing protein n=1 Tax=Streptomyces sp. NPDC008122 TaxID=3364810 RepID=UPI0036E5FFDC
MTTEAPYLAIAAEIRRRILAGRLAPGDRVPSTRAITREWGVAMATATKALAALRHEGLVRVEPGVGTVVVDPKRTRHSTTSTLTRARIVRTALDLADTEGLNAVTMRRLATLLDTSAMALYRHVPGKGELVRLMTDEACGEVPLGPAPTDWREGLERAARWLREVYARHRWMAQVMASLSRPVLSANAMAYTEWVLGVLWETPLSPSQKLHAHLTLFAFVQGLAMADDLEEQARLDTGLSDDEWMEQNEPRFDAMQSGGPYPLLDAIAHDGGFELSLESLFEFGLRRTLDGIATLIDETSG